ncbi:hypothetical protein Tco_1002274 [Tanacetum coccineum]|uniref:Uncharacterized protein n=1 Tax=Tanacetum coccineum TaxID=301880 RepID=A0ABQ5F5U5_9ASTR
MQTFGADKHHSLQGFSPQKISISLINHYMMQRDIWDNSEVLFGRIGINKGRPLNHNCMMTLTLSSEQKAKPFTTTMSGLQSSLMTAEHAQDDMSKIQLKLSKYCRDNMLAEWGVDLLPLKTSVWTSQQSDWRSDFDLLYLMYLIENLQNTFALLTQYTSTLSSLKQTINSAVSMYKLKIQAGKFTRSAGLQLVMGIGGARRTGGANRPDIPDQAGFKSLQLQQGYGSRIKECTQPKRITSTLPKNETCRRHRCCLRDLALNVDNVFQADDYDAYDSDVDEAPTAQTMFMANLSSADPVCDEAGPSYDSDILSEVQDHDHFQDAICEHHEEHGMQDDVQPSYVVGSHADYTSDSNMTPYDQYVKDNAVPVVQNNASMVPNDMYVMIDNDLHEPKAQSVFKAPTYTVADNSLNVWNCNITRNKLEGMKSAKFELTEREQKIDEQLRIVICDCNIKEENLKKELHSVKLQLASTIQHNKLMVDEVTSL